jgi:hypothetical protein
MLDAAIKKRSSKQILALHSTCKRANNHGRDGDLKDSWQIKEETEDDERSSCREKARGSRWKGPKIP